MRPDTSLVSIMTVNNEIGVKQPVKEIGKVLMKKTTPYPFVTSNNQRLGSEGDNDRRLKRLCSNAVLCVSFT